MCTYETTCTQFLFNYFILLQWQVRHHTHTQMHFLSTPFLSRGQCLLQLHLQSVTTDCWVNCSVSMLADISWWIRRSEAEVISDLDYLSGVNERRTPPSVYEGQIQLKRRFLFSARSSKFTQMNYCPVLTDTSCLFVSCFFFCCYCFFLAYLNLISQRIFVIIVLCTLFALTLSPLVFSLRLMSVLKA